MPEPARLGSTYGRCASQATIALQIATGDCSQSNESTRPLLGLGKRRVLMRVASLESVLAVATLVSAIVVVLWGVKILYGT